MKIDLQEITIKKLTDGFVDNDELGVVAYGGKLDIRPPYQREFIYKDKQRNAVIDSVQRDFPLNVMYWAVRNTAKRRAGLLTNKEDRPAFPFYKDSLLIPLLIEFDHAFSECDATGNPGKARAQILRAVKGCWGRG